MSESYKMSDKSESILDTVQDIVDNGEKVILFTKFRTCATMIANDIQKILKEPVLLYTGAEDDAAREQAVDYFKNTSTYDILIGTEAMAEGLNLQCAKYVINIDQPDTLAIKTQRIGRARRAGSAFDNVIVYVGQSIHVRTRLKQHIYHMENANLNGRKMYELLLAAKLGGCKIDYILCEKVPVKQLKDVETSWICDLLPILNDNYTPYDNDNLTIYQVLDFVRSRKMRLIKELMK